MFEALVTTAAALVLIYAAIGLAIVAYEVYTYDDCLADLREHGWSLAILVVVMWPVFLWQWLRTKL
jgi:hypothetical protein